MKQQYHNESNESNAYDQDLPMQLWAEVARTTVYVQNRTPHQLLDNKTPE